MSSAAAQTACRVFGAALGALGVALSLATLLLLGHVLAAYPLWQREPLAALPSIPLPFALVFMVVGVRAVSVAPGQSQLLALSGWRRLSFVVFGCGVLMAVALHWAALIVPAVIATLCSLRDPWLSRVLLWLWPF